MNITGIYIYADGSDLEDISVPIERALEKWLQETGIEALIINQKYDRTPDLMPDDLADWDLGLNFSVEQLPKLKKITHFLYQLALKHNRDFVLGYYDEKSGFTEDISFFGVEFDKPNIEEINAFLSNDC